MANFFDFSSESIYVYFFLLDASGSMKQYRQDVRNGIKMFIENLKKIPESNSMAVCFCTFADSYYPEDFVHISNVKINYSTGGATALYYSITKASKELLDYITRVSEEKNCIPTTTFMLLSDGEPCNDPGNFTDAAKAIKQLNYAGVTTVFVPFGEAISSEFGENLGFKETNKVSDNLEYFLGVEVSQASIKQSQKIGGDFSGNFFSQAQSNGISGGYSQTTAQVLDDTSWIDEI